MINKIEEKFSKISNAIYSFKDDPTEDIPLLFYHKKEHVLYVNFENKDDLVDFLNAKIDGNGFWHIPKKNISKRCGCGKKDNKKNNSQENNKPTGVWVIPAKPIGEEYRGLSALREVGNWRINKKRCETT